METQNNELEVMRQQLAILNKKLESQTIINDRMLREVMSGKMSWIRKYIWTEIIAIPFVIIFMLYVASELKISYAPMVFISVVGVISVAIEYKVNIIGERAFLQDNIKEIVSRLLKMKRQRLAIEMAGSACIVVWCVWVYFEIYKTEGNETDIPFLIMCVLAGLIIGGIVEYVIFRNMQRTNDKIIGQLQDLKK